MRFATNMAGGLLTRIKRRAQGLSDLSEMESIVQHLQSLLNTRRGDSALDPAYGLPDFTDTLHTLPAGIAAVCEEIARTVERYEPRLTDVEVDLLDLEGVLLQFEIRAELARTGSAVRLRTDMSASGHVHVR